MPGRTPNPEFSGPTRLHTAACWLQRLVWTTLAAAVLGGIMVVAGFWWFVWAVPTQEVQLDGRADGIVVLTGGSSRVADAIELLSEGRGKRLLITGVHRATTAAEIARMAPAYQRLIACCVDLDHSALNTVGNAVGTKRWVITRDIKSLVVVTSNYHMPRALAELGSQLPGVTLIPYPVLPEKVRTDQWWEPTTARLLLTEYLKYIVAQLRMRLEPGYAAAGPRDARATPREAPQGRPTAS